MALILIARAVRAVLLLLFLALAVLSCSPGIEMEGEAVADMVVVNGGKFSRGDLFGEGLDNELPVHQVTVATFRLARCEVTVREFRSFVDSTGYKSSAEGKIDLAEHERIVGLIRSGELSRPEMENEYQRLLEYSGAGRWHTDRPAWGLDSDINWSDPGFPQTGNNPVVCVSWDDAIHYCNWLSEQEGLPKAYETITGDLVDAHGVATLDIAKVKGFRLPTEAEWEFAAREGGRKVRFGSGQDIARSGEINFRADIEEHSYSEIGEYRRGTNAVGSLPPNSRGLHDMSGNAWEWVSDAYAEYAPDDQINPYATGSEQILRGGRWGGTAFEARVSHRTAWARNDRCNNSGFRIARSGS